MLRQAAYVKRLMVAKERRAAAAASSMAKASDVNQGLGIPMLLRDPEDVDLNSKLEQSVLDARQDLRPDNTAKAQDPKIEEYMQYCDAKYPQDPYRYTLTCERLYRFMFYQMFCEAKPRGGNRKKLASATYFDVDCYNSVMDSLRAAGGNISGIPCPKKPVGPTVFRAYKAVFRLLYKK